MYKRITKLLFVLLLVLWAVMLAVHPRQVRASDEWTSTDTALQLVLSATMVIDAAQTADIKNHPNIIEKSYITARVLGENPEQLETAAYFAGSMVISYAIAKALPQPYRRIYQSVDIGFRASTIRNNYWIGLRCGF